LLQKHLLQNGKLFAGEKKTPKMKKEPYIRNLIGVTQEEMAGLLHISRSQWALYELGLRGLPKGARPLFAELVAQIIPNEKEKKSLPLPTPPQLKQHQQKLEKLVGDIEYQRRAIAKKMAAVEKQQAAQQGARKGLDFLNSRQAKDVAPTPVHNQVAMKARVILEKDHTGMLMMHEIDLEVLAFKKKLVESKMREVALRLEKDLGK
jgi:transcriptional regulator with XRE-family HTH domain